MMSPKTKLIVGGVGAAAVTSSVVMSSVALANQGTSAVQEEKKTTELTRKEFDELKTSLEENLKTEIGKLPTPKSEVTKQEFEDLKNRVTTLEQANTAADEVPAAVTNPEVEGLKTQLGKITTDLEELKTKVEKPGVDVSKHPSITALEQQAKSLKETLEKLDKEQKAQESRYERLDREVKELEREKVDKLEKQFNGLDEKLKAQDTKITQEIEIAKVDVSNDIKGQVAEIKKLTEEAKKQVEDLKGIKQFSDANGNNEYMQKLAKHAEDDRFLIRKDITDLKNQVKDLSNKVLDLVNQ